MTKVMFVVLVAALSLFGPFSRASTMEEDNIVSLLLFARFNINAVQDCSSAIVQNSLSVDCLKNSIFNDSRFINLTLLFNLSLNNTMIPRFVGINQLRSFVRLMINREISEPEESASGENSTEISIIRDFTQCGYYPACVVNALPGNLWSFTCDQPIIIFIAIIGIILSAIVIISNVLIITVTMRTKSLRKPHGYFKLSLALADLIAGIFVVPSIVHNSLNAIDYNKQVYSVVEVAQFASSNITRTAEGDFLGVMGVMSTITAVLSLLVLSVDSFLAVKWPMQYRIGDIVTSKKAILVVVIIWVASVLLAFLPLLADSVVVYELAYATFQYLPFVLPLEGTEDGDSPFSRYPHAFAYVVIVWGIPFVVTWILTVLTSIQSRKMLKHMKEARRRSVRSEKALNKVDRDLIRTVTVVLTLFTITVLPIFAVGIATVVSPTGECNSQGLVLAFFFSTYLFICGRFLNVIIYNVFNKEFRKAFSNFTSSLATLCCPNVIYSGLPKKSSNGRSTKDRASSADKSHSKETEVTTRATSGSISLSVSTERSALPSPSTNTTYKYSVSGESEAQGPMYNNAALTIDEAAEENN